MSAVASGKIFTLQSYTLNRKAKLSGHHHKIFKLISDTNLVSKLKTILADITTLKVDAIVNAANNAMRGGGGVDGAIHRAGGPDVLADCIKRFPRGLATGDAGWTTAGNMSAKWVIHTVGPNYRAGQRDPQLLRSCYRRSLAVADEIGAKTIAFPLISAGVYGWPKEEAARIGVQTCASCHTNVETIFFVAFDQRAKALLEAAL